MVQIPRDFVTIMGNLVNAQLHITHPQLTLLDCVSLFCIFSMIDRLVCLVTLVILCLIPSHGARLTCGANKHNCRMCMLQNMHIRIAEAFGAFSCHPHIMQTPPPTIVKGAWRTDCDAQHFRVIDDTVRGEYDWLPLGEFLHKYLREDSPYAHHPVIQAEVSEVPCAIKGCCNVLLAFRPKTSDYFAFHQVG